MKPRPHAQLLHAIDVCIQILASRVTEPSLLRDMSQVRKIFCDLPDLAALIARLEKVTASASALGEQAREILELARNRNGEQNKGTAMSDNDPVGTCDDCGENIYDHDVPDTDETDDDEPLICSACAARKRLP